MEIWFSMRSNGTLFQTLLFELSHHSRNPSIIEFRKKHVPPQTRMLGGVWSEGRKAFPYPDLQASAIDFNALTHLYPEFHINMKWACQFYCKIFIRQFFKEI